MIGIIGNARRDGKSSFATLISYCKDREGVAHSGIQNIHFEESAAAEMESLAFENRRCKDPLMHIILSWREMELPSNAQVDEAVRIVLKELDLQECQAVREHLSRTDFGLKSPTWALDNTVESCDNANPSKIELSPIG